jgi:hypothetical protein|nr:MAG TPA: hypothetical protein [Caudoviricetes sp.]
MAFKFSQFHEILRTPIKNINRPIKASDVDVNRFASNVSKNTANTNRQFIDRQYISLSGCNKLDLVNKMDKIYLAFPYIIQLHFNLSHVYGVNLTSFLFYRWLHEEIYTKYGLKASNVLENKAMPIAYYINHNITYDDYGDDNNNEQPSMGKRKAARYANTRLLGFKAMNKNGSSHDFPFIFFIKNFMVQYDGYQFGIILTFKNLDKINVDNLKPVAKYGLSLRFTNDLRENATLISPTFAGTSYHYDLSDDSPTDKISGVDLGNPSIWK